MNVGCFQKKVIDEAWRIYPNKNTGGLSSRAHRKEQNKRSAFIEGGKYVLELVAMLNKDQNVQVSDTTKAK